MHADTDTKYNNPGTQSCTSWCQTSEPGPSYLTCIAAWDNSTRLNVGCDAVAGAPVSCQCGGPSGGEASGISKGSGDCMRWHDSPAVLRCAQSFCRLSDGLIEYVPGHCLTCQYSIVRSEGARLLAISIITLVHHSYGIFHSNEM